MSNMTPEQLKKEVEKFKRKFRDKDTEKVLDEVLEQYLDKEVDYDKEEIEIWKQRIEKIEYFWKSACKVVYPEFEGRINIKIKREKDKIEGFEKSKR